LVQLREQFPAEGNLVVDVAQGGPAQGERFFRGGDGFRELAGAAQAGGVLPEAGWPPAGLFLRPPPPPPGPPPPPPPPPTPRPAPRPRAPWPLPPHLRPARGPSAQYTRPPRPSTKSLPPLPPRPRRPRRVPLPDQPPHQLLDRVLRQSLQHPDNLRDFLRL